MGSVHIDNGFITIIKAAFFAALIFFPLYSWSSPALKELDTEFVSRLDLIMLRLEQKVKMYELERRIVGQDVYELKQAGVNFHSDRGRIEFYAVINANPEILPCTLALRDFMQEFSFGGTDDDAGKLFYAFYFMPARSPGLSYEINRYQSVYQSTIFRVEVADSRGLSKFECSFDGLSKRITGSRVNE